MREGTQKRIPQLLCFKIGRVSQNFHEHGRKQRPRLCLLQYAEFFVPDQEERPVSEAGILPVLRRMENSVGRQGDDFPDDLPRSVPKRCR